MKKEERIFTVTSILESLFPNPPIPLTHKDNFTLLVAVVLSARATDKKVNEITPTLFSVADTPKKMALIPFETLREIIKPCGLSPAKAKALIGLSKILIEKHQGQVPNTFKDLEALPGVGHKTASVVMAQAFQKPSFPVDTHIHRCSKRWGLSSGKSVTKTEEDLKKIFPKEKWIDLHLQIIYYARAYCPSRGHKIENCPICKRLKS